MEDESDEIVWRRVTSGDARAFGLVWDRHRSRVHRYVQATGVEPADAEDVTAMAFLELWRRRANVRFVDGSVLPWLIVTAQNTVRNATRARRRHRAFLAALPAPDPHTDHADDVADRLDPRLPRLRRELARARPDDARLLALTAVEGFTLRDAAAVLGLSESAAKMRLSRLRARLAIALDTLPEGTL